MKVTIYHNPRCSKSRQTLQLLQEQGIEPEVVEYLKTPPATEQLQNFVTQMGKSSARDIMRTGESEYKEQNLSAPNTSEEALIQSMHDTPILMQRPIVVVEKDGQNKVAMGRPPEDVLKIL